MIMEIYRKEGRNNLFDKFLSCAGLDPGYLPECLKILRTFTAEKRIEIYAKSGRILRTLIKKHKPLFVLTNGNPDQQRNKIRSVNWNGIDEEMTFILADEIEPKPSPAGIMHILKRTGIEKDKAIFIGDSPVDKECASRGGVKFVNIADIAI
jgi:HAD superfamily hydrolase (TIGR01549 family)